MKEIGDSFLFYMLKVSVFVLSTKAQFFTVKTLLISIQFQRECYFDILFRILYSAYLIAIYFYYIFILPLATGYRLSEKYLYFYKHCLCH